MNPQTMYSFISTHIHKSSYHNIKRNQYLNCTSWSFRCAHNFIYLYVRVRVRIFAWFFFRRFFSFAWLVCIVCTYLCFYVRLCMYQVSTNFAYILLCVALCLSHHKPYGKINNRNVICQLKKPQNSNLFCKPPDERGSERERKAEKKKRRNMWCTTILSVCVCVCARKRG